MDYKCYNSYYLQLQKATLQWMYIPYCDKWMSGIDSKNWDVEYYERLFDTTLEV